QPRGSPSVPSRSNAPAISVAPWPTMPAVCSGVSVARASTGRASSACASSVLSVRLPITSAASVANARSAGARASARSNAARAPMMASRTLGGQIWLVSTGTGSRARRPRRKRSACRRRRFTVIIPGLFFQAARELGHAPRVSPRMAGHSKWANIRRRHAAQARRRDRGAVAEARAGSQSVRYEGYGPGGGSVEVLADPLEFDAVRAVLTDRGFEPATAEVTQRAATTVVLSGEEAVSMVQLLDALEGLDEVRDVYSNVEISDEVLARV